MRPPAATPAPTGGRPLTDASPPLPAGRAEQIAAEHYGITGRAKRLAGERDDNFGISTADGSAYLLKVAHAAEDRLVTDFHTRALLHLAEADPGLPVQRVLPTLTGQAELTLPQEDGVSRTARLTSYLDGRLLHTVAAGPPLRRDIGRTLARLNRSLRTFTHPAAFHPLLWDLQHAHQLRALVADLPPGPGTGLLLDCLDRFDEVVGPQLPALRAQVVHNDFSGDNVLVDTAGLHVTGILDFGDMVHTSLAADVAVAAAYQLGDGDGDGADPLAPALDVVAGYHAADPLTVPELELLYDLVLTRMVVRIAITQWRAVRFPDNRDYILRNTPRSWSQLERLRATCAETATARILHACGME